jgi:hypothetical protein
LIALTAHSICTKSDVIDHTVDLIGINAHFTATIARTTASLEKTTATGAAARFTHR